jgi:hypothetical protein
MDIVRRVLLPLALLASLPAHALINRCADQQGTFIYSDKPCAAHHAVERAPPLPNPSEQQTPAANANPAAAKALVDERSLRSVALDAGRLQNTGIGCPAYSRAALAEATRRAFLSRDANQLAGITDWRTSSRGAADRLLSRYAYLVKHPITNVSVGSVAASTLEATAQAAPLPGEPEVLSDVATPPVETIVVELAGATAADPTMIQYFRFASSGRCYWLKP